LLGSHVDVSKVVTNPDRPAGRGMPVGGSPVKEAASGAGIDVLQPTTVRSPEFRALLADLGPDVCVVVAYGAILPPQLLAVPRLGFVNVHFSLLPAYRGAAPVQRALMDGAVETGVSIMVLTEGMDEGPVLDARAVAVEDDDTSGTLGRRLAREGAALLVSTIERYAGGEITPVAQDDSLATYAPKVTSDDARISWAQPPNAICNLVRALAPAPGAWTTFRTKRVKVHAVTPVNVRKRLAPGEIMVDEKLVAGTGGAPLEVVAAQMEGRRPFPGAELARGLRPEAGERFE
jgi:methionyl-tRNA formyltransferase